MTGPRTIRVEEGEHLAWIVLDRPDRANALSEQLLDELDAALDRLAGEGPPVVGIRGEGRHFCAGYDLGQVAGVEAPDPVADRDRLARNVERFAAFWDHPKPIVAAVHGSCIGGGTQIALFADLTVVADDASIGEPALPIGGGYIASQWAPLVGPKRAKELAFVCGNSIDGPTAVRWGLANHSVPAGELLAAVESLAARMAKSPPDVLRIQKLSVTRACEWMRDAARVAAELDALAHQSPQVRAVREHVAQVGLQDALATYRSPRTTPLTPEV